MRVVLLMVVVVVIAWLAQVQLGALRQSAPEPEQHGLDRDVPGTPRVPGDMSAFEQQVQQYLDDAARQRLDVLEP